MAILEENVVPIIVLDDDDEKSENLMAGSASKLADSQGIGFDMNRVEDGESFVIPTIGKAAGAEDIQNSGETVLIEDVIGVKVNGHASLNGSVVSEQIVKGNEHPCLIDGQSAERGFIVGDLVWCKIKNDPWFPAQVYDPKDATEFALRYRQEDRLLVGFFGDGTCSWCLPSQLLPFVENFAEMSRACNSKKFLRAVQEAVDEFGRIVESGTICKCVPENRTGGLARPMAEKFGVKSEVLVPEVEVKRLSVPKYEPYDVLAKIRDLAKAVSVGNELHLAILKCRLSVFYRFKGGYQLPFYEEPIYIEGLEEENQNLSPVVNGFSPFASGDNMYQRKKKKSLAGFMEENVKDEPESVGRFTSGKKSRKRKVEFLDLNSEIVCQDSVETYTTSRNLVEIEVIAGEDSSVDIKQKLHNLSTPRERKKSKYLSPPYMVLVDSKRDSSSSKSSSKRVNDASKENLPNEKLYTIMPFVLSDVEIPVHELLLKLQLAAVTPQYLSNKGSFDMVSAFVSALRSSSSNDKLYRKCITGQKQKTSLPFQRKLSGTVEPIPMKMESSCPCDTDGFISDVKFITRELEIVTVILEKHQTKFSAEEKASLKEDIKQIVEKVENMSAKVNAACEKVRMAEEASSGRN